MGYYSGVRCEEVGERVNIYTIAGDKIKFIDENGHEDQREFAKKNFPKGTILTIKEIDIDSWCSYVTVEEFPNLKFNTVMFEDIKMTPPSDSSLKKAREILDYLAKEELADFTSSDYAYYIEAEALIAQALDEAKALKLPERTYGADNLNEKAWGYEQGWNACLDEVIRMNGEME